MFKPTPQKLGLFSIALKRLTALQGSARYAFATLGLALLFITTFVMTTTPKQAYATPPNTLNFQARLENANGSIVPDGNYSIEFKLYDASSSSGSSQGSCTGDADCLWTETRIGANQVHVANGYLSVNLGSVTAFSGINWDQQLYLTMNIYNPNTSSWDGEMNPRLSLTGVPYAFQSKQAENLYYDGTNGYTSTLNFQDATGGDQIFQIADQGATGTYNLLTAPAGGSYTGVGVELQSVPPGTAQTGSFNVSGTGIVGTELETPIVDATTSGGTLYLGSGNAASGSITVGYGMGSGTINIGGGGQTGTINLGRSTATNTVNIGAVAGNGSTQTINIGTSSTSGSTTNVTIGSTISSSQTKLQAGGTSENITGTGINVVSSSTSAVAIGNGALGTSSTLNVDTTADVNNLALGLSGGADNTDFEAGSGSWIARGGASRTYNGSQYLYGAHSEKVTTTATAGDGINLPITLTAAQEYTLSFNVYTGTGNTVPPHDLVFGYAYDGSNETTDACDNGASATTSGGWEYESCTFTPATVSGSPYIFIKQADATARSFFIDGVDLAATTSINQPVYHAGTVQLAGTLTSPLVLQPASNYTNALDILNANGQEQLVVDTVNNQVLIGTQTGSAKLTVATSNYVAGKFIQNGTSDILDLANGGGNVLTVSSTGVTLLKTGTDSTTAFQVENHSGTAALDVDTSNGYVGVGTASPSRTLDVAVNNSQVAAPMTLLEQAGTGDSSMEFKDPSNSYYVGQDASNSDALVLSSGYAATHDRSSGSPYVFGYDSITHSFEDGSNNGLITSMPFTTSLAGTLSQISVDLAADNPGDHFAVAIYADSGSNYPGTLLASSPSTAITINTVDGDNWNTATLSSSVSLSASTKYWLAYETDDSGVAYWLDETKGDVCWQTISGSYGSWTPASSTSCDSGVAANTYGIYGMVTPTGSSHSLTDTFSNPLFTLAQNGSATFQGMSDSSAAFQVQDPAGDSVFQVDTTTQSVQIASSLDTVSNNNLAIGNVNATGVDIGNSGIDNLTTIYGSGLVKSATGLDSTTAFQVQDAGGTAIFSADTTNAQINTYGGSLSVHGIADPDAPTLATTGTGGSLTAGTYYYEISATDPAGDETVAVASSPNSVTTTGSTSKNTLTWTAVTNASGYNIYRSIDGGNTWYENTVSSATTSITDNGSNFTWATQGYPNINTNSTGGIVLQNGTALTLDGGNGNYGGFLVYDPTYNYLSINNTNSGGGIYLQSDSFLAFRDTGTYTTQFTIDDTGQTLFQNRVDSTNAFQVDDHSNNTVLNVDTSNDRVGVGTASPSRTLDVAVNNTSSTAPAFLLEQAGTGDASVELKTSGQSWFTGVDQSDSNKFKIASSSSDNTSNSFGYQTQGSQTDTNDNNSMECSVYSAVASGTVTSLHVYIANANSGDSFQMAIYDATGTSGDPGSRLGFSSSSTISGDGWYSVTVSATVTASTNYWICYNSNGTTSTNNITGDNGSTNQATWKAQTFGTWPASFGSTAGHANIKDSLFATVSASAYDSFGTPLFTMSSSGQALFQNSTDSTTAFQIQSTSAGTAFDVDTADGRVGIGTSSPNAQLEVGGTTYLGTQVLTANDQADVCLFTNSSCSAAQSGAFNNQLNIFGGSSQTRHLLLYQAVGGNAFIGSSYADLVIETTSNNANIWLEPNGTGKVISSTIYAVNPSNGSAESWHKCSIPSGWSDNSTTGTNGFQYRLLPDGDVEMSLNMIGPSGGAHGTTVCTLPSGYYDSTNDQNAILATSIYAASDGQSAHFNISTTGVVKAFGIASGGAVISGTTVFPTNQ